MVDVVPTLLALCFLLVSVSLLLPLAVRLTLPHTLLLALFGVGLGLGEAAFGDLVGRHLGFGLGVARDVLAGLSQIDLGADTMLFLFLPPLLFTAGLQVDVRLLVDEIAAVVLLAVVAVLVCIAVVGAAMNAASGQALAVCLLLGAIVATTDPAAVVAIFRDLGAPRRLTTLVSGESLFNDAAAIAVFAILIEVVGGAGMADPGRGALLLLASLCGGLALGYLLARLATALLSYLHETPIAAITLSLALAYTAFVVGEVHLGVSGVVAVVTSALTFKIHGPTRLAPGTWSLLRQTWDQLDFWASSLIFVLASMLAVRLLPGAMLTDLGLLLVLVVATLLARVLVLHGLLPILAALGWTKPVGQRQRAVILWGGLRGAVTLVLALSVSQDQAIPPEVRQFVSVLATAYVLFTLFVAAPTLRPLLRLLRLDQLSASEQALRDQVMALSREAVHRQVSETAADYGLDPALVEDVAPSAATGESPAESPAGLPLEERRRVVGLVLATRERELFLEHFQERSISRHRVGALLAASDRLIDAVKTDGLDGYHAASGGLVRLERALRLAIWLQRRFGWGHLLALRLADRFETLLGAQLVLRELQVFLGGALVPLLGREVVAELGDLLGARQAAVRDALAAVDLQYPVYARALRRQYLARAALRLEDEAYRRHFRESLIGREVYADLQRDLALRRGLYEQRPTLDLGLRLAEMIKRVPLFAGLDRLALARLAQQLRARVVYPGEKVVRRGARGDAMYFIASGRVEVVLSDRRVPLETGDFFGELALLTRRPRNADVVAQGFCHLLVLERRDFRRLLRRDPELKAAIESIAETRMAEARDAAAE